MVSKYINLTKEFNILRQSKIMIEYDKIALFLIIYFDNVILITAMMQKCSSYYVVESYCGHISKLVASQLPATDHRQTKGPLKKPSRSRFLLNSFN